jgi:hypothetical protein
MLGVGGIVYMGCRAELSDGLVGSSDDPWTQVLS